MADAKGKWQQEKEKPLQKTKGRTAKAVRPFLYAKNIPALGPTDSSQRRRAQVSLFPVDFSDHLFHLGRAFLQPVPFVRIQRHVQHFFNAALTHDGGQTDTQLV